MAAHTKSHKQAVLQRKHSKEMVKKIEAGKQERKAERGIVIAAHLPPWTLTVVMLVCSGMMLVFALRDFWTTGKNIAGGWDEALLVRAVYREVYQLMVQNTLSTHCLCPTLAVHKEHGLV
jgi:hypothetical protein